MIGRKVSRCQGRLGAERIVAADGGLQEGTPGLLRRGGVFAAVDALGKLLAFVVVALITRQQSAHTFGVVVAGIAGAAVFQTFLDGGLGLALAAAVARREQVTNAIAGAKVLIALSVAIPAFVAAALLTPTAAVWAATLACGATGAVLPVTALVAAHRLGYASVALIGPNGLFVLLLLAAPALGPASLLAIFAACNAVCAAVAFLPDEVRPAAVAIAQGWRLYRQNLANAVYMIATTLYGRIDTVVLALTGHVLAAGLYGTYFRVVLAAVGFASWLTPLSYRSLADRLTARANLVWLEKRLAVVALIMSLGLLLLGPAVLVLLTDGHRLPFLASTLLALLAMPTVLSAPLGGALVVSGRSRTLARLSLIVLFVACCLYAALIPPFGVDGAALASLLAEVIALVLLWREVMLTSRQSAPSARVESQ